MAFKDFNVPETGSKEAPVVEKGNIADDTIKEILEAKKKMAIIDALGGPVRTGPPQSDGLTAATAVSKAMDVFEKQSEKAQEMVLSKEKDVQAARLEADKAKAELYTTVITQISGAMDRLEKIRDEIKSGKSEKLEKPLLEQLEEAQKIGAILNPQAPSPPTSSGGDRQVEIALSTMRMNHEAAMKKLDMEMERMKADLRIRLAEFSDNRKSKDREYEDSKKFRDNAFSTVGDIVAAASEGFAHKTGSSGGVASEVRATREAGSAPGPNPKSQIVPGFECKDCGTPVAVPEGAKEVVCPNEVCGTQYAIRG